MVGAIYMRKIRTSIKIGVIISSVPDKEHAYIPALTLGAIYTALEDVCDENAIVNLVGDIKRFNLTQLTTINKKNIKNIAYEQKLKEEGLIWKKDWYRNYQRDVQRRNMLDRYLLNQPQFIMSEERNISFVNSIEEARHSHLIDEELMNIKKGTIDNHRPTISIYLNDTFFNDAIGSICVYDQYILGVDLFVGGQNPFAIAPIARFAALVGLPYLTTYGGVDFLTTNKLTYFRTLTRTTSEYKAIANVIVELLRHFHWKHGSLVYQSTEDKTSASYYIATAVWKELRNSVNNLSFKKKNFFEEATEVLVNELNLDSRVVIMCTSPDNVRHLLLTAHRLGFINGEYVFINLDIFSGEEYLNRPWYRENDTDERNERARKAYEALLILTIRKPSMEHFDEFSKRVEAKTKQLFRMSNGTVPTIKKGEVNNFITAFYDSIIIYADALSRAIEKGKHPSDGVAITNLMWNRSYHGATGEIVLNHNGDRVVDFDLLDMDYESGNFSSVATYHSSNQTFVLNPFKKIYWHGKNTTPPADTPQCGFDNSKCPDKQIPFWMWIIIAMSISMVIALVFSVFIYRKSRYEAELAGMANYMIKWSELKYSGVEKFVEFGNNADESQLSIENDGYDEDDLASKPNGMSKKKNYKIYDANDEDEMNLLSREDSQRVDGNKKDHRNSVANSIFTITSTFDGTNNKAFTTTALYKSSIVALKKIHQSRIDTNRALMLEMKQMKDMNHEHIARFVGLCVDTPYHFIITEYCPKGSLRDILENEQIRLDWIFRHSLMHDIVKGMSYIHNSEIHSHGNLKSSNCVVDSRFVLKITDFGFHSLRSPPSNNEQELTKDHAYYQGLLWTAPELLRQSNPKPGGTQRGDVYSFAIILQEIIYRKGVFHFEEERDMLPEEIYRSVKEGTGLRPTIKPDACNAPEVAELILKCWAEEVADRPDFNHIRGIMRRINKGNETGNIVDNLLKRMEQYANNLESIVEERTSDYLQEKKRAEELLYRLLPPAVTKELLSGKTVTAETFDCVTIYFSDICGFTSISAAITPMEVVDLLNNLYICFDSIIEHFDVYKVETIGDAYMVVSGLPTRNGDRHASEISRMSLALLNGIHSIKVGKNKNEQLRIRIGIHSGPCVAGVVGRKMPRYCLFGDTVNTCSRMESNGLPLRIHVSPSTKKILDQYNQFDCQLRGPVSMKGKGVITTYWLIGEHGGLQVAPPLDPDPLETQFRNLAKQQRNSIKIPEKKLDEHKRRTLKPASSEITVSKKPSLTDQIISSSTCDVFEENRNLYEKYMEEKPINIQQLKEELPETKVKKQITQSDILIKKKNVCTKCNRSKSRERRRRNRSKGNKIPEEEFELSSLLQMKEQHINKESNSIHCLQCCKHHKNCSVHHSNLSTNMNFNYENNEMSNMATENDEVSIISQSNDTQSKQKSNLKNSII
ncbi:hypothetical protein SNEBB_001321 [Seison nebaliae]|nr:hypothetical protein SNEBB_001321 [Seison nebaliae]